MKVVLLAGGLGTRMREETEYRPKPMVEVGGKPILWHIMKIFASFGHNEFIICAGYKGEQIQDYFLNFGSRNLDFSLTLGDRESLIFHGSHPEFDWKVTVAQTGYDTPTGGRLKKVQRHVGDDDFFCTYGDGVASINLTELLSSHRASGKPATMSVTRPTSRFGVINFDADYSVTDFREKPVENSFINIGFFVFGNKIFDYLNESSILENDGLKEVADRGSLNAFVHDGFWQPMDTYRESLLLNKLWTANKAPWKSWD